MKTTPILSLVSALVLGASATQAALIAYEGFDLPGTPTTTGLNSGATATGWDESIWQVAQGTNGYQSTSLSLPGHFASVGGAHVDPAASAGIRRMFIPEVANPPELSTADGSEVWFSVLVNPTNLGGDLRVFLFNTDGGNTFGIGARFATTGLEASATTVDAPLGSSVTRTGAVKVPVVTNTTYLVIGRIEFNGTPFSGLDDVLTVNAFSAYPGSGMIDTTSFESGASTLTGFNVPTNFDQPNPNAGSRPVNALIRGGNTGTYIVDEFRIGTTLADVAVAIPEPSTYAAIAGVLALVGVAARRRIRR